MSSAIKCIVNPETLLEHNKFINKYKCIMDWDLFINKEMNPDQRIHSCLAVAF